jgi:RNA polymerase sigma factor (sigma-70 family)
LIALGDWAEAQLAKRYQALTFKIVQKQANYYAHPELPNLEFDLHSSANQKLTMTIRKYNPSKDCKFSTLYTPSLERDLSREARWHRTQVTRLRERVSLNNVRQEDDSPLVNRMADPRTVTVDAASNQMDMANMLHLAMTRLLDDREQEVLRLRTSGQTLEEVGETLNVTRERIRQIESACYRKLRQSPELRSFLPKPLEEMESKIQKPAVSPETKDAIQTRAYEFFIRQTAVQEFEEDEPEFVIDLYRSDREKHPGEPLAPTRILKEKPADDMAAALEKLKGFPLQDQIVGALLGFGYEVKAIAATLGLPKKTINAIQAKTETQYAAGQRDLRNPVITETQQAFIPQLQGMARRAVELRHIEKLPNVEIASQLLGSKKPQSVIHLRWIYACGALRLEHLAKPIASAETFEQVQQAVLALPENQRKIFTAHYGLYDSFPQTRSKIILSTGGSVGKKQHTTAVTKQFTDGLKTLTQQTDLPRETLEAILMASTGTWKKPVGA